MADRDNSDKEQLNDRWRQVNEALDDLADMRCWPTGKKIAEVEGGCWLSLTKSCMRRGKTGRFSVLCRGLLTERS